jgi:hypothetical protein
MVKGLGIEEKSKEKQITGYQLINISMADHIPIPHRPGARC